MNHVKKFEDFDFNQTLPITTKNFLTNFYSCDECDALWTEYNKQSNVCKCCGSDEVEELPEDEWYEISKRRKEDVVDLEQQKKQDEETAVDLTSLKKGSGFLERKLN